MKRPLKIAVICLIVGVIVIGAFVAAVLVLPETDLLRVRVQRQLEALTGQKVLLGAMEVSFSFPSLAHLAVEGISVQTREGRQLFSADKVVLSPETAPLIRGELSIKSVEITGFRTFVERSRDGVIHAPFAVIPASSEGMQSADERIPQSDPATKPQDDQSSAAHPKDQTGRGVKWSISRIVLADGTVEWIDHHVIPGKKVAIPVRQISGTLTQAKQKAVEIALQAHLASGKDGDSPLEINGNVLPAPDYSGIERVSLSLSSPCFRTGHILPYLPRATKPLYVLSCGDVIVRMEMAKGRSPMISIKAGLKTQPQQANLIGLDVDLSFGEEFGPLEEARIKTETDSLPLEYFSELVPSGFPLDPKIGMIKGRVSGVWKGSRDWRFTGDVALEGAEPTGRFKGIARRVRVVARGAVEPDAVELKSLDVSDSANLGTVSGKIGGLSSGKTTVDLKLGLVANRGWARALGLRVPRMLRIDGTLPIHGQIRGKPSNLWLDLVADISRASIAWSPHFEKPAGGKGSLSIKGTLLPKGTKKISGPILNADTALNVTGVRLRVLPEGVWLSDALVNFSSKVSYRKGEAHLSKSRLGVRRGSEAKEVLLARGNIFRLGSSEPRVKEGKATVVLNRETLDLAGIPKTRGLKITGSSMLEVSFAGTPSSLEWSIGLPLTPLDIRKERAFRKPGGVKGSFTAAGETHAKAITIKSALLKLPGLLVHAKGNATDSSGTFKELAVDLKKADLKGIARYLPELARLGPSGPVSAAFLIKKTQGEVTPTGTVELLGVGLRPEKGEWKLANGKGTLSIKGPTLVLKEFKGDLAGFVRGPIRLEGRLSPIGPVENLNGKVSVSVSKGKVEGRGLLKTVTDAAPILRAILNQKVDPSQGGPLAFDILSADFLISSGVAKTDNLHLSGPRINAGSVGKMTLASSRMDMLAAVQLMVPEVKAVGKIPVVRRILKNNEGLLRSLGLDKELKRFGIKIPKSKEQAPDAEDSEVKPVVFMFAIKGPFGDARVDLVAERMVESNTLARLKRLLGGSK